MEDRVRRLAGCFQRVLGDQVQALGRELGLRDRKLKVAEFVATLVLGWWENPQATREELALRAREWFGVEVTPQALSERLTERVAQLLRRLLDRLCAEAVTGEPTALPILERFAGVFLDDCTTIALPDELREEFPGCGNQVTGAARAALKMLVRLEVLSGACIRRPVATETSRSVRRRTCRPADRCCCGTAGSSIWQSWSGCSRRRSSG